MTSAENSINQSDKDNAENIHPSFAADKWAEILIAEAKKDKHAPFKPENLPQLIALKRSDVAAYEWLLDRLSLIGVSKGRIEKAITREEVNMRRSAVAEKNQTTQLIELIPASDLFHAEDGRPYADVKLDGGGRQTLLIGGVDLEQHLIRRFFLATGSAPNTDALQGAVNTLKAQARFDGPEREVFIRVGEGEDKTYIDLGDTTGRALEIDADDWRFNSEPPVRFARRKGMLPLPIPEKGGNISELRRFVNVKDENGFILIVSCLLMALRAKGPYPPLILVGEQGTAKSTLTTLLRKLVDPNSAPLRSMPRDPRDFFIGVANGWVSAFDNLSYLPEQASDSLCRVSTGGGFATRALYTDDEEHLIDVMRPIILNGISNVATRGDLADRAIIQTLEPIPGDTRKTETEFWTEFDAAAPRIFGALLDMCVHGFKRLPGIKLPQPPRMADFATWATACETAVWPEGAFMAAYERNKAEANDDVIAASPLAVKICELAEDLKESKGAEWKGTATDLLTKLESMNLDEKVQRDRRMWPSSGRVLSEWLRRVTPALREKGVEVVYTRENGDRLIVVSPAAKPKNPVSGESSAPKKRRMKEKANPSSGAKY